MNSSREEGGAAGGISCVVKVRYIYRVSVRLGLGLGLCMVRFRVRFRVDSR